MSTDPWSRPTSEEYNAFYAGYINCVPDTNLLAYFTEQGLIVKSELAGVAESDASICHPPYTWTIKQVVGHMIDAERVFAHRLHWIASGDTQPLTGMDQNAFVNAFDYVSPSISDLVDELVTSRAANALLLRRLSPDMASRSGRADGKPITVRALAWIMAGHIEYHMRIIRQRLGL